MALMLMLVVSPRVLFCLRLNDIIGHGRSLSDCWDLDPEPPAAVRDLHQISPKKILSCFFKRCLKSLSCQAAFSRPWVDKRRERQKKKTQKKDGNPGVFSLSRWNIYHPLGGRRWTLIWLRKHIPFPSLMSAKGKPCQSSGRFRFQPLWFMCSSWPLSTPAPFVEGGSPCARASRSVWRAAQEAGVFQRLCWPRGVMWNPHDTWGPTAVRTSVL